MSFGRRAMLLFGAVAMVLSVVRDGTRTRSFYCPIAHHVFDASPCAPDREDALDAEIGRPGDRATADGSGSPMVRTADCCVERWHASAAVAPTSTIERPSVARAGVVALLPAPKLELATASAKVPFGIAHAVRAGPPPPGAAERRAQLMVFNN
jgi:hypothetical protein